MLSAEQKKELVNLVIDGNITLIREFIEELKEPEELKELEVEHNNNLMTINHQKEMINLIIDGELYPIKEFAKELDEEYDFDNVYKNYINFYHPQCKFCGSDVSKLDYDTIKTRHMDCSAIDWTIGCCCCDYSEDYHKPTHAQFYCNQQCLKNSSFC